MPSADLIISKTDLTDIEWREHETPALQDGEVRLRVEAFALTANNITYAAFADFAGYWNFFPTGEETKGRVPFWGFAHVAESKAEGVKQGQRVYGYLPASTDLVVTPSKLNPLNFTDVSAHRVPLPSFYNVYHFIENDSVYDAAFEDAQMLVRPLYATGWLIDDCLMEREAPPAHVIVSSASAKTSLAYASAARKRSGLTLTGLTSASNKAFTEASGLYDHVATYDDMGAIVDAGHAIHVDIRGNPAMRTPLAEALGGKLAAHLQVGATDWDAPRGADLPTQTSPDVPNSGDIANEVFFAPGHAEICAKRMGPKEMGTALNADMRAFYPVMTDLLTIQHIDARTGLVKAWQDTLAGSVAPDQGLIVRFSAD
jgi:hypothetical protein